MRRWIMSSALAALFLGGAVHAEVAPQDGTDFSSAEQQVFAAPHLENLPDSATLRYRYRKNEAGQAAVDDEVVVTARREEGRPGRAVQVDYLHGDRHLALPEVDNATSNPLILYFLESDVRDMHRRLGGQENYFRRRIRLALAEGAHVSTVAVRYRGQVLQGTRVEIHPYANDTLAERFRGMADKVYLFTLSPQVPGGVYELRSRVAAVASREEPLLEEILTLRDEASDGTPPNAPAPGYITKGE
ncbi:MAG: hypothetical protein ROZ37_17490 [Aromatoleum sp.]|uniref:hypothetical protein n=1 Tax=Aromatoleum sp. TaxID=2307007 RepID=UPI0028959864|nr:hypothetical protein [Aromatoleum sp.]MDT3672118.1 hypothetical protein [Aromatoleum sp.]